jgi:hypothetical protein
LERQPATCNEAANHEAKYWPADADQIRDFNQVQWQQSRVVKKGIAGKPTVFHMHGDLAGVWTSRIWHIDCSFNHALMVVNK